MRIDIVCKVRLLWLLWLGFASVTVADGTRVLEFYHTHTERSLRVEYYTDGEYAAEAMAEIEQFLSDFRNGRARPIDPGLLDLLYEIKQRTGTEQPFEVISGYRSPETNEMLRKAGRGVAKHSMHLKGKAIDIRLRGVPLTRLRDIALEIGGGGVGYYEQSNFVHVDTGRVRRW